MSEREERQQRQREFEEKVNEEFAKLAAALAAGFRRLMPGMLAFARSIHEGMWSAYRKAGMPYGDDADGLMRWAREQGEMAALQAAREREEALKTPLPRR